MASSEPRFGLGISSGFRSCSTVQYSSKWVALLSNTWISPTTRSERKWESLSRVTSLPDNLDGASVVPLLDSKHLILIANYRPVVDRFCLEFPGGLVDNNEDVGAAAKRELNEETGYLVKNELAGTQGIYGYAVPWIGNESAKTVICEVISDQQRPEDHQKLDSEEIIRVVVIHDIYDGTSLLQKVKDISESKGYAISAAVGWFATGFDLDNYL